jgi:hypothetical protein
MHADRRELIGYDAKVICGGGWATLYGSQGWRLRHLWTMNRKMQENHS